ncbi:unnamed protein product, partial [Brassica rapa subsp. trilocularis]
MSTQDPQTLELDTMIPEKQKRPVLVTAAPFVKENMRQRACFAVLEEETTTVDNLPSFRNITGPYFLESLHRDWCGNSPNWCKLPMIGKPGGDGGHCCFFLLLKAVK